MENKIYIDSLGYNFLEPILVEKQDNKIIITEEDLKKAINQAYEAGKRCAYNYEIVPNTPLVPSTPSTPVNPVNPYYPTYPYWTCNSNGTNNNDTNVKNIKVYGGTN